MKKIIKRTLATLSVLFLFFTIFLLYVSPQKTSPFLDANGKVLANSIAEIKTIPINGVPQRLLIRGENKNNPILLHVHGGPGSPDHALIKHKGLNLEDIFTVCYWEQRGAGASYSKAIPTETMTLEQMALDGIAVTEYLIKMLEQEKVYIQGHSWGTAVGSNMIYQRPELYHAYFGIGQMAKSRISEERSYDFVYQAAEKAKDQASLDILNKIGRPPYTTDQEWINNFMPERGIVKKYDGQKEAFQMSEFEIYKTFLFYREYSISDKLNALNGYPYSAQNMWMDAIDVNFFETIKEQQVPVYIFQGKNDLHTVSSVAKAYYDNLEAPKKAYFEFEESAHEPHFDEFEKYKSIIINDILMMNII